MALRAALFGAVVCGLFVCMDVVEYRSAQVGDACMSDKGNTLPRLFGIAVASHSVWLLVCLIMTTLAIKHINAHMREVIRGESPVAKAKFEWEIPCTFCGLALASLALLFWAMVGDCKDVRSCLEVPLMWWFIAAQAPGTLFVLLLAIFVALAVLALICAFAYWIGTTVLDTVCLWCQYQKVLKQSELELETAL